MSIRTVNFKRSDFDLSSCSYHNHVDYWKCKEMIQQYVQTGTGLPEFVSVEKDETNHVGRVVKTYYCEERIMSDVWDNVRHAVVYSPETKGQKLWAYGPVQTGEFIDVHCGPSGDGFSVHYEVSVDAPEGMLAQYEAEVAEEQRKAAELAEQLRAEREARTIRIGKRVKVVRGRKVPVGTTGEVFWMGNNGWGETVGVATSDKKVWRVSKAGKKYQTWRDVVFVASKNCEVA